MSVIEYANLLLRQQREAGIGRDARDGGDVGQTTEGLHHLITFITSTVALMGVGAICWTPLSSVNRNPAAVAAALFIRPVMSFVPAFAAARMTGLGSHSSVT
jgi:hypothetical protein